jgi:hypothetical protein
MKKVSLFSLSLQNTKVRREELRYFIEIKELYQKNFFKSKILRYSFYLDGLF